MPKPDGTLTYEEWLQDLVQHTQFDEGDTPELFRKLGEEFLEEELRKEGVPRSRRLKKKSKKDQAPIQIKGG
jgi:hypothetical protein